MIVIDKALWYGLGFVLESIRRAAESELSDVDRLRELLMDAQLRFEAGELDASELSETEGQILERLRQIGGGEQQPIGAASIEIEAAELPRPRRARLQPARAHARRVGQ